MAIKETRFATALALSGLTLLALLITTTDICTGKPATSSAKPKQYIFGRSSTPTEARTLGLSAVPAYVNFPGGGQKLGIYITANSNGIPRQMGLVPGTVLLTIDSIAAQSPSTVDSVVNSHKGGLVKITYVRMVDGLPVISSRSVNLPSQGGTANFMPPGFPNFKAGGSTDATPLTELESHAVSVFNSDRSQNGGLSSLQTDSALTSLARTYAETLLAGGGALSHFDKSGRSPQDRANQAGLNVKIRENLAMEPRWNKSRPDKDHVDAAELAMMNEPKNQPNHRGNILCTDGKALGIGIARNASMLIIVQEISCN